MSARLKLVPHLTLEEALVAYRAAKSGDDKLRWQAVVMKLEGHTAAEIAAVAQRRPDWARRVLRRFNAEGPEGVKDKRAQHPGRPQLLSPEQRNALSLAIENDFPPGGGFWTGPKVAIWMSQLLNRPISAGRGWDYLKRLGFSVKVPRPRHTGSSREAREAFKKGGSPTE